MSSLKPVTKRELTKALKGLPGWKLSNNGKFLSKAYSFKTHVDALVGVARITVYAEIFKHHPDIKFTYQKILITLTTHEIGGLTANDIKLAAKIEERISG